MKHFIVGPVEMYDCIKEVYTKTHPYFRTEEFGTIVKNNLKRLSNLLGNFVENSLIYLTMSGTGAMEAVVENCTYKNDKVLVINGGTFGHRFCELLKHHNIEYSSIDLNFGEPLSLNHLELYQNQNYTMLFVNLHETSTGQLYDISMISDFCKKNNLELVVDAISTFLADDYDMEKYSIDITILSSQKGLCLSPGLSFVSMSKRMINKILNNSKTITKYNDFKDYLKNITRGQTPYTPAVNIMYELEAMLDFIDEQGGKEKWLSEIAQKCQYFRDKAKEFGLIIPASYSLSNMLTPVICENVNANELVKYLRDKYELCVNPCGGELADRLFRVAHIGNTTKEDIDELLKKIVLSIEEIKNKELVYDRK